MACPEAARRGGSLVTHIVIHVLTPLHVGVGQGIGGVDLPVARQKPTNFPYIPGSTLKGCFRARLSSHPNARVLFGPEPEPHLDDSAGAVFFGDAHLVAMPVRHAEKTFVWVTCPYLLAAVGRIGIELARSPGDAANLVLENDVAVRAKSPVRTVVDWIATATRHATAFVRERVFELSDDDFGWACEFATQVDVRNRIGLDTGVVVDKALWAEESLAPESILVAAIDRRSQNVDLAPLNVGGLVLGGKNTIGRGVCRVTFGNGRSA